MRHIPNIISIIRIGMIPFFVHQLLQERFVSAGVLLVISGCTDALDGFLARRFQWVSQVGKILDPIADKLTQVSVCIALGYVIGQRYHWIWWFFAVILIKELVMLVLGAGLLKRGAKLSGAKIWGKLNTVLFYGSMAVLVLFPNVPKQLIFVLLAATTVSAVISGVSYIPDYRAYRADLKKKPDEQEAE